jgi:hypothetical protein
VGRRSRKARTRAEPPAGAAASRDRAGGGDPRNGAAGERVARGYARGRQRDEEARAKLEPLAPGERPLAVTIAAVVAFAVAAANLVLYLAGWDVRGQDANLGGALAVCVVFAAAGVGMWRTRYWAVIGFQVLLGVLIVSAALSLMLASNLSGALLSLAVIVLAGPLFWFLIRAMARIQMPQR